LQQFITRSRCQPNTNGRQKTSNHYHTLTINSLKITNILINDMTTNQADRMSSVPLMNLHERRNHQTNNSTPIEADYDWSDQEVEEFSRDPLESVLMQMRLWPQAISRQQCVQSALFFSAIALAIGFVLAYLLFLFLYPVTSATGGCQFVDDRRSENANFAVKLMRNVNFDHLREYFKVDFEVAAMKMRECGLDSVVVDHDFVSLSEPDEKLFNGVKLKSKEGLLFQANCTNHLRFCPLSVDISDINDVQFVYANLGSLEDYQIFQSKGIAINNKIILVRLTSIPVWEIVYIAETKGAVGLLLFSTTNSYDLDFEDPLNLFPSDIPIQFISFEDAKQLLKEMKGQDAPPSWKITNDFRVKLNSNDGKHLSISAHYRKKDHNVSNVVGVIRGKIEPDRFVLIGSERNLGKGSFHSSGLLLELARVYGNLVKNDKFQPRRTIVFCSWDSVHDNPLGIAKWLKKNSHWLPEKMVAYINIDVLLDGPSSIQTWTVPSLAKFLNESIQKVPDFDFKKVNVFENYLHTDSDYGTSNFSDGSKQFLNIGVPVVDIHLKITDFDVKKNEKIRQIVKTSGRQYDKVGDKSDTKSRIRAIVTSCDYLTAEAHLIIQLAACLTNSVILPFDINDYSSVLNETVKRSQHSFKVRALNDQIMMAERLLSQLSSTDPCNINTNNLVNIFSCTTKKANLSLFECRIMKITSILYSVCDILKKILLI
uniref:Peptidase M28 domain-containing protein n=1 Tax=Strigamia maritima TaxID=126957 RepID=T1J8L1_STRMM